MTWCSTSSPETPCVASSARRHPPFLSKGCRPSQHAVPIPGGPGQVIIELTETAAMDDPHTGLKGLKELTDIGLKLSIDDFGAGYSSLSYLKKLPASEIKLDRALLQDIETSESARMIVETAIRMGLGYQVVAEGVETEKSARLLESLGAEMLQGYWICSPKPLLELRAWLELERETPGLQGLH
ncbi:EAL domain-containing protein [Marinobacter sp. es.048]|uniref:EAL domain-containing protein n=1 Tax=Marinobacter sp. es.048 TaxID=1761795 RepID=UPI000B58DDB6|nr:EAL domain-containing protein [Marinobacter sp. es.048]